MFYFKAALFKQLILS